MTSRKNRKPEDLHGATVDCSNFAERLPQDRCLSTLPAFFSPLAVRKNQVYVKNRKGVYEYILGGSTDTKLLDVRVFDEATKKTVYASQTKKAEAKSESNCPLCAIGHDANKRKLWKFAEMDADHVTAWSKGGTTTVKNCQMLCKSHNQAKGNR